ncbi:hypothetical protein BC830DRAFT_673544 [Chytriomyces sp. MP71]|nr:hypothetical protein BC830DRAFT_673544 [Chytriomyces sp. MP71]
MIDSLFHHSFVFFVPLLHQGRCIPIVPRNQMESTVATLDCSIPAALAAIQMWLFVWFSWFVFKKELPLRKLGWENAASITNLLLAAFIFSLMLFFILEAGISFYLLEADKALQAGKFVVLGITQATYCIFCWTCAADIVRRHTHKYILMFFKCILYVSPLLCLSPAIVEVSVMMADSPLVPQRHLAGYAYNISSLILLALSLFFVIQFMREILGFKQVSGHTSTDFLVIAQCGLTSSVFIVLALCFSSALLDVKGEITALICRSMNDVLLFLASVTVARLKYLLINNMKHRDAQSTRDLVNEITKSKHELDRALPLDPLQGLTSISMADLSSVKVDLSEPTSRCKLAKNY